MLSSEYDMFEQGIVVRINKSKAPTAEEMSKFVGSWHLPSSEEVGKVPERGNGLLAERSYFDDTDSIEGGSDSESGRISHPSISSISSNQGQTIPIKYELRGK